jgi:hypothetical protein
MIAPGSRQVIHLQVFGHMHSEPRHQSGEIVRPGDGHGDVPNGILHNKVPADDPCHQLAETGICVSVCATTDGDVRGKLGITERGKGAGHCSEQEQQRHSRPAVAGRRPDRAENARADHCGDPQSCQVEHREAPFHPALLILLQAGIAEDARNGFPAEKLGLQHGQFFAKGKNFVFWRENWNR